MTIHNTNLATRLEEVPEPQLEVVRAGRSELDARANLAALVALGFARCPAPLVARSLGRGPSSTYALTAPECVGGLRAYELLLAPRPFASVVIRGLLHHTAPTCGMPSRHALVGMLAALLQTFFAVSITAGFCWVTIMVARGRLWPSNSLCTTPSFTRA